MELWALFEDAIVELRILKNIRAGSLIRIHHIKISPFFIFFFQKKHGNDNMIFCSKFWWIHQGNELWRKLGETKFKLRSWFQTVSTSHIIDTKLTKKQCIFFRVVSLSGKKWKYCSELHWPILSLNDRAAGRSSTFSSAAALHLNWPPCLKVKVFWFFWRTGWNSGWHTFTPLCYQIQNFSLTAFRG